MRIGPANRALFACLVVVFAWHEAFAIDPSEVLVVYNTYDSNPLDGIDPVGKQIADHYAQTHGLATNQLLGLDLGAETTTISAADYLTSIREPIANALTPFTNVVVTTKGMPLRVQNGVTNPGTYTDLHGDPWTVVQWRATSSLESELTRIDYIGDTSTPENTLISQQMMGDQSYQFTSPPFPVGHFSNNPYYGSTESFSHATYGTRLTARLDGFSVDDVNMAIDRAQNAFVGPNNTPGGPFHFVIDNDPSHNYSDATMTGLDNLLTSKGLPHAYDDTSAFISDAPGPVLAYTSHGTHQSATPDFEPGVGSYVATSLDFELADGAVFNSWESFNAQNFDLLGNYTSTTGTPPDIHLRGQALLGEWLARGGTAAVGNVAEPTASFNTVMNEDFLIANLLEGHTFAEAAWSAARQLSWVNTVVGDPLMTWKMLLPGDANMDGVVDVGDLAVMGTFNFGHGIDEATLGWSQGDLNGDGFIDMADVALVASSWGQVSDWSTTTPNLTDPSSPLAMALFASMQPIPEPSSIALAVVGMASLAAFGWRRRRRHATSA